MCQFNWVWLNVLIWQSCKKLIDILEKSKRLFTVSFLGSWSMVRTIFVMGFCLMTRISISVEVKMLAIGIHFQKESNIYCSILFQLLFGVFFLVVTVFFSWNFPECFLQGNNFNIWNNLFILFCWFCVLIQKGIENLVKFNCSQVAINTCSQFEVGSQLQIILKLLTRS